MPSARPCICPRHGLPQPDCGIPDDGFRLPAPAYSPDPDDWMHIDLRCAAPSPSLSTSESSFNDGGDVQEEQFRSMTTRVSVRQITQQSDQLTREELQGLPEHRGAPLNQGGRVLTARRIPNEDQQLQQAPEAPPPPVSTDIPPPSFETVTAHTIPEPVAHENSPTWSEVEAQTIVNMVLRPETTPDSGGYTRWLANRRDDGPIMMQMWEERVAERREEQRARERRRRRRRTGGAMSWRRAVGAAALVVVFGVIGWVSWEAIYDMVEEDGGADVQ